MGRLKEILMGVAISVIIGLLGWVAVNTKDVPYLKEDLRQQSERQDELIQELLDKNEALKERVLALEIRYQQK